MSGPDLDHLTEQMRLDELELQIDRNRDLALTASEVGGVIGFVAAGIALLWMMAGCGPTLFPGLFG